MIGSGDAGSRLRNVLRILIPLGALAAAAVALLLLLLQGLRPENAPDLVPVPTAPFGNVTRDELAFAWLVPADGAPVRVDILGEGQAALLWSSQPTRSGSLRLAPEQARNLPTGDLYWRPVALSRGGPERPGDLAAFTLVP